MEIDQHAVEELSKAFGATIKDHYTRPPSPMRVFEVLNALSIAAGFVIAGTGVDQDQMRAWFDSSLNDAQKCANETAAQITRGGQ